MALSSDQYSPYSLPSDRPGMRFEPRTLREGERAMEAAGTYFPAMARRLRVHDAASDGDKCAEAMVIVGDMEIEHGDERAVRPSVTGGAGVCSCQR